MASAATSLAMVLAVLAALSYGLPSAHSDIDFITRTCKKTTNASLCVAVLSADPKIGQASTKHELASIALQIATNTAKKNAAVICDLGGKYHGTPEGPAWDVCVKAHVIAATELMVDARPGFNGGDYVETSKIVSEAKGAGDACENAFKGIHKKSPVANMDRETTERCGLDPRDVCVVGVARTPIGALLGSLSSLPATKLGSVAIQGALRRASVDPALVQEVFMGNVLSANLGQAPARQAALGAGLPNTVPCTTVNKVCSSGMKAVMLAAQSIQLGINDVVVAGGMESMSNAPKYAATARRGSRFGHDVLIDGVLKDGLWDVYNDFHMGMCAELCADQHSITREEQDAYAVQSNEHGIAARDSGVFDWEIIPVEIPSGRGRPPVVVDKDESLAKYDPVKLKKLGPAFKKNGCVTAGNSSSISDGAAAIVLVSGEKAKNLGLQVLARIRVN